MNTKINFVKCHVTIFYFFKSFLDSSNCSFKIGRLELKCQTLTSSAQAHLIVNEPSSNT